MATKKITFAEAKEFIEKIGPIIQKKALERGYHVCSPVIAQACVESNFGYSSLSAKYFNFFGLKSGKYWKGKSVNLKTKEEYKQGQLTTINDNFRVFDNMEEGVKGYFDFISTKRYANLKDATTPKQYLEYLKADGYATSFKYVATNMDYISKYNLTRFDSFKQEQDLKSNEEIAREVINGKWGTGIDRKERLTKAGYDYAVIQSLVNQMLKKK